MDLSLSSKNLLFLSFQIYHIKQWGISIQICPFRWRPNWPYQQARSPTTDCGITQLTLNKPKTIDHKSIATDNEEKDSQLTHHCTCTYNTNTIFKSSFFLNCQFSRIFPKQQSRRRKLLEKGFSTSKCFSRKNKNH